MSKVLPHFDHSVWLSYGLVKPLVSIVVLDKILVEKLDPIYIWLDKLVLLGISKNGLNHLGNWTQKEND